MTQDREQTKQIEAMVQVLTDKVDCQKCAFKGGGIPPAESCYHCESRVLFEAGYRLIDPEKLTLMETLPYTNKMLNKAYGRGANDQLAHDREKLTEG